MKQLLFYLFLFSNICQAMQQNENFGSSITYESDTHQYNAAVKLIDDITDFSDCYEILNVGSDPNISFYFSDKAPWAHVHGIDKSPDTIEKARLRNSAHKKNITFDTFDGNRDMLFFIDQFDIVFYSATLHWIKNQEALFKDLVKSAAKNSTILIKAATASTDHPLLQTFSELKQEEPYKSMFLKTDLTKEFHPVNLKMVEEWCTQNNLATLAIDIQPNQFKFTTNEELISWLGSWFSDFPSIGKLSQETRTSFITAFAAKYIPKIIQQDGSIVHEWPQLILKATKPYRTSGQMY